VALLWAFVAASAFCIAMAGAQAVRMLRDCDGNVVRLTGQIVTVEAAVARAQQQIEAQRVLLLEAEAWMRARQNSEH
jgi:hypothetical protein